MGDEAGGTFRWKRHLKRSVPDQVLAGKRCLGDGSFVGQHANGTRHFGGVTSHDDGWRKKFVSGRAPADELDRALSLDGSDEGIRGSVRLTFFR